MAYSEVLTVALHRYVEWAARVTWTYAFQPTIGIVRPLLTRFVAGAWADFMGVVLATMRDEGENGE